MSCSFAAFATRASLWLRRTERPVIRSCSMSRVYSKKIVGFGTTRSYDPAPHGKHVVALAAADTAQVSHDRVIFLLNFFDELRRRVPLNVN